MPEFIPGIELSRRFYAEGEDGTRRMRLTPGEPVQHRVFPTTLHAFVMQQIAYDIDRPLDAADWLTISSQKLRELTAGAVHHDGIGELSALRDRFAWRPHDIWLYLLAAGWQRIGQEEHLAAGSHKPYARASPTSRCKKSQRAG